MNRGLLFLRPAGLDLRPAVLGFLLMATLSACSSAPQPPAGLAGVRDQLNKLQANGELSVLAPVAIKQAEQAVLLAEQPQRDLALSQHLVFVADRQVNIAWALAQGRQAQDQQQQLLKARDEARLSSRTREADRAHQDANQARQQADLARSDASMARAETLSAEQQAAELQAQINLLNAKVTERGWVVTLGDVLFDTGKANLKSSTSQHLTDLAQFLGKYPGRGALIEGHTDNVGNDDYNQGLSQRRADSVRNYLQNHGIASSRLSSSGKGETLPIAGNDSASGRQQNRRVEVIITDNAVAAR